MYPEDNNQNKGRNIAVGIIITLVFGGLLAGCIAVVVQFAKLGENGQLDKWMAENSENGEDEIAEFGYYDDDGEFHYYGEEDYYDYDDDDDRFGYSTHEDYEGYETGEYFSFPADNRVEGLSYTVEMEEEEYYDEDSYYTDIYYSYAIVEGDVPNVDKINETIRGEGESLISFYEEVYKPSMYGEEDGIEAELLCNVTFMSEEILSVVYQETIYYGEQSDYAMDYYVYCLNFDMKNGQCLENTGMLTIDEEFVEDFRDRSDRQNGDSLLQYYFDDRELMEAFEDEASLILFYCPQGMEIGLNMDMGWVTVTYPDYDQYLNKM